MTHTSFAMRPGTGTETGARFWLHRRTGLSHFDELTSADLPEALRSFDWSGCQTHADVIQALGAAGWRQEPWADIRFFELFIKPRTRWTCRVYRESPHTGRAIAGFFLRR